MKVIDQLYLATCVRHAIEQADPSETVVVSPTVWNIIDNKHLLCQFAKEHTVNLVVGHAQS